MTVHPQVGPPWNLPSEEAERFLAAIAARRQFVPPGRRLRPGGHWHAKPDGILCTLVAYDPGEAPDADGRRAADLDVGQVLVELAQPLCDAYNTLIAGRGREGES